MPHLSCDKPQAVISDRSSLVQNDCIAKNTFRLRLLAPGIAPLVKPGQFVMLRLPDRSDPLLGRPLAVYRTGSEGSLEVVYLVVGKMTARLAELPAGAPVDIWGPLGNGFEAAGYDQIIMVAGGIGQTPFLMLTKQWVEQHGPGSATLLFGVRSKDRICCVDDFREAGAKVLLATDDGSEGYHGPVTQLLPKVFSEANSTINRTKVLCCGPLPMLRSAFLECQKLGLPCDVSLESPMACGLGICFSCVVEYRRDDSNYEYVRTCSEGPVFDAYRLKMTDAG